MTLQQLSIQPLMPKLVEQAFNSVFRIRQNLIQVNRVLISNKNMMPFTFGRWLQIRERLSKALKVAERRLGRRIQKNSSELYKDHCSYSYGCFSQINDIVECWNCPYNLDSAELAQSPDSSAVPIQVNQGAIQKKQQPRKKYRIADVPNKLSIFIDGGIDYIDGSLPAFDSDIPF